MAAHLDQLTVRRVTNRDRSFYTLLGPYLARRDIVKELGGPMWDDDDKTWWVALDGREVVGFVAARDPGDGGMVTLCSTWVRPEWRRRGVYRRLFIDRLGALAGRRLRSRCADASLPVFLAHGFTVAHERGRFTEVRRDPS